MKSLTVTVGPVFSTLSDEHQAMVRKALRELPIKERAALLQRRSGNCKRSDSYSEKAYRLALRHVRQSLASEGFVVCSGLPSIVEGGLGSIIEGGLRNTLDRIARAGRQVLPADV